MLSKHFIVLFVLLAAILGTKPSFCQITFLRDIYAFDESTAIAVGPDGQVVKTTNGGVDWDIQYPTNEWLGAIDFYQNTGWVVGDKGTILKTTDRGKTWISQSIGPQSVSFASVSFIDSLTGWATAGFDSIYKTSDGGQNWSVLPMDTTNHFLFEAVHFSDPDTGWAVGISGVIIKTTDGGHTWTTQHCDTPLGVCPGNLYDVFALDGTNAWAVGLDSTIFHTTNGGETWKIEVRESRFSPTSSVLNSVHFVNAQTGWIAGGIPGVILKTTDGGGTWESQFEDPGRSIDLSAVHSPNPDVAWAVGDFRDENGVNLAIILRTVDGGQTWENLSDNIVSVERDEADYENTPNGFRLYQNYPNPFNPATTISYSLARKSLVRINVYNLRGQRLETLINEVQPAGDYSVVFDGSQLSSGVYMYKIETRGFQQTRKMLLAR